MTLSEADRDDLRKQGYSDNEINEALAEVEQEELSGSYSRGQQQVASDPRQYSRHSSFASRTEQDIVRWQLELNDILERAEHILRGDRIVFKEGHMVWIDNPDPNNNPLNEEGIQEIMKELSMYVNRNTLLADYENDEINYKVFDFGRRINNLIFMRYEDFGMDTESKKKHYEMIVGEMVDIVHSAYKRALKGGERRSLREMINVSQSTSNTGMMMPNGQPQQQVRARGILNPMRYISGKYH